MKATQRATTPDAPTTEEKKRFTKHQWITFAIALPIAVVVMYGFRAANAPSEPAPPAEVTPARIEALVQTIDRYVVDVGELPATLSDLVASHHGEVEVRDGWSRALSYRLDAVDGEAGYTVCSAGPDGRFGSHDDVCVARVLLR